MAAAFLRWGKVLPLTNTAFRGVGGGGRSLGVSGERTTSRGAIGVPHQNTVRDQASSSSSVESLPGEADVVVVGGGVAGCSVLYHLAKLGLTNTILLEAHQLTAGTTWHTAGLFYRLSSNEVDCMLHGSTMRICLSLEEETGVNPGWINNGSLFLTSRKEDQPRERQQSLEQMMSLSKVFGVESHLLNPAQIKDLHPLLNVNDLQSAVYTPTDGSMDPAGICLALTRAARWAGARVVEGCRVTDITTAETTLGGRKVTEVHTTRGVIKTNVVVNATGITGLLDIRSSHEVHTHTPVRPMSSGTCQ
ncbi:sarcosine dehydrogenase, mitochondrial-like [Homarus americanus]|uniref:sarcosine dehydrogenase, mitochondrial-like n=1 Tax=Homarus americanus TaxID=6706 RepID=UPI001C43813A|nr:sarcosine dehydrogenase, mitochondrial-like [Homarus americanus]